MLAQKNLAANHTNCTKGSLSVLIVSLLFLASCSTQPTDVRTVVPGDGLVYLETQDLGKALHAVADNDAFRAAAKSQPDFSALDGIKVGVAVTGFETKEEKVTDENSVLNFRPRFVAVTETNAWNFQAIKFAENKLGEFVNDVYGGGVELERFPRYDGDYFIWTAQDGRKAYGLVIGSLVFFGNDESAIEKCIAVRKGEAESMAKGGKLPSDDSLAAGFVSTDGVAQIANIASIKFAVGAGEEEEVRGFIARVLPTILRKAVTEVSWTSTKTEQGIEDVYSTALDPDVAQVLNETLKPGGAVDPSEFAVFPADVVSATRYDIPDPRVAWRSLLLTAQKQTDGLSGSVIEAVSESLFEPYGVDAPELFLASIRGKIVTLRFDAEGDDVVVLAETIDIAKLKSSLAKEFELSRPGERVGDAEVWRSDEDDLALAVAGKRVLLGHAESVLKCLNSSGGSSLAEALKKADAASAVSVASDIDPNSTLVSVLSQSNGDKKPLAQTYRTSTTFGPNGMKRTEVSSFGLIGSIIKQFAKEQ